MRINIDNLGILRQAEIEVADLTIICGANNTGKTYATYAIYGFLQFWNTLFSPDFLSKDEEKRLFIDGIVEIPFTSIIAKANTLLSDACNDYLSFLPTVFGAHDRTFESAKFVVEDINPSVGFLHFEKNEHYFGSIEKPVVTIKQFRHNDYLTITYDIEAAEDEGMMNSTVLFLVNQRILSITTLSQFPTPFIASIERTGAAMFQRELDISRNRLLEHLGNKDVELSPGMLLNSLYDRRYALPVKDDVDFNRDLVNIVKNESFISKEHPDIIRRFDNVLRGEYTITNEGIFFSPTKSKIKLSLGESASSVRSLLNLGIYLRHKARPGDMLMIDEPELNLHPSNQRLLARLLAMLVNIGIKVFVTTHSDYILKEFNTLIMFKNLSNGAPNEKKLSNILLKYGYSSNEFLNGDNVRAYIAKRAKINLAGSTRKTEQNTLVSAKIDSQGIEIEDFDLVINEMNEIQDELIYGGIV